MATERIELLIDKKHNLLPTVTKQIGSCLWKFSIRKTEDTGTHIVIECEPNDTINYWECKALFNIEVSPNGSEAESRIEVMKISSNYTNDAIFYKLKENVTSVALEFRTPELQVFEFTKKALFDEPVDNITDFKFIVEGQQLYVCKKILATYSKYMYDWFDDECSQTEMVITKASCNLFRVFLGLLYFQDYLLTDVYYLTMFESASSNKANSCLEECEEYFFNPNYEVNYSTSWQIPLHYLMQEVTLARMSYSDFIMVTEKRSKLTDVVLSVGDKKFYVSKQLLAYQSSYFYTLFFSDFKEKGKEEVGLMEIDPNDFEKFLEIVYNPNCVITEKSVKALLELSQMYDVQSIFRKCVEFVQATSHMNQAMKIKIATDFDIPELFDHVLSTLDYSDLEKLKGMEGFDELDDSTVAKITKYLLDEKEKSDRDEERRARESYPYNNDCGCRYIFY